MSYKDPWTLNIDYSTQIDQFANRPISEVIRRLEKRIQQLEEAAMFDEALRQEYPALQDLYDQYMMTKQIIGKGTKNER